MSEASAASVRQIRQQSDTLDKKKQVKISITDNIDYLEDENLVSGYTDVAVLQGQDEHQPVEQASSCNIIG